MTHVQEQMRVDALAERIDTTDREIDDELYHIWTKKFPVSELGDVKLVIAEKETEDDAENPIKYLATTWLLVERDASVSNIELGD